MYTYIIEIEIKINEENHRFVSKVNATNFKEAIECIKRDYAISFDVISLKRYKEGKL